MKATQKELNEEARKLLKSYGVIGDVTKRLVGDKPTIYYSERQNQIFQAVLYYVSNEEEYEKAVAEFEKKYDAFVFHCVLTHTEFGDLFSMLYLPRDKEEWEQIEDDYKNGYPLAYVKNMEDEFSSEIGYIGIKGAMGGIVRFA